MVCRVGEQVGDKSCRVAVMEIGERRDTADFLGQASASTIHIGLLSQRHQWYHYLYINILHGVSQGG